MAKSIHLPALAAAALCCALPVMRPAEAARALQAARAPTLLDRFLSHLHTLRVSFTQTLLDAHGALLSRSAGTLIVERPGKFRWSIHPLPAKPGEAAPGAGQLMVADGRNLWFYDRDLEQVTVQPVSAALSATPAMLLSGTVDVRKHFTEHLAGRREGLEWVFVEPLHASGADFRSALFGFDHGTLKRMILEDSLGQEATIVFEHVVVNGPVAAAAFRFTPPQGVDVIGTPAR
ncbi:MAG: outer membrane lipoprotein chaperone LolA [Steroidobacteraceae bacterium]